ncbi:MAG: hypothetical protein LBL90_03540 [Prevotellaceae bacterium]|nr:hypothetical protein [Prevotellaceae bacterium]
MQTSSAVISQLMPPDYRVLHHPEWVTDKKRNVCFYMPEMAFLLPANQRQRK